MFASTQCKVIAVSISWGDFKKVDMRIWRILDVSPFPDAKTPSYNLKINFGELGIRDSSSYITNYEQKELEGNYFIAVVNFPKKQISNFMSEVFVLGSLSGNGVILITSDKPSQVKPGNKIA